MPRETAGGGNKKIQVLYALFNLTHKCFFQIFFLSQHKLAYVRESLLVCSSAVITKWKNVRFKNRRFDYIPVVTLTHCKAFNRSSLRRLMELTFVRNLINYGTVLIMVFNPTFFVKQYDLLNLVMCGDGD